jgi:hypothetical protein
MLSIEIDVRTSTAPFILQRHGLATVTGYKVAHVSREPVGRKWPGSWLRAQWLRRSCHVAPTAPTSTTGGGKNGARNKGGGSMGQRELLERPQLSCQFVWSGWRSAVKLTTGIPRVQLFVARHALTAQFLCASRKAFYVVDGDEDV